MMMMLMMMMVMQRLGGMGAWGTLQS